MSVEAYVLAAIVEEGSPKKAFQAGVLKSDFQMYDEEWDWIITQVECKRKINWRRFQQAFPDFERVVPDERLQELCEELKAESAFTAISSAMEQVQEEMTPENVIEKASFLHEILTDALRMHSPVNDVMMSDHADYMRRMKELMLLRENGIAPGIPTGIRTLDEYWGGLQNGRAILVLGRPGDAKSMFQAKLCASAFMDGRRGGLFSPEMNEDEHRARVATLLTALPEVQEALNLKKAFRNRDLMDGKGYNYKTYRRFWQWYQEQPGEIVLFNRQNRRQKMTPTYIESKVTDYGLEYVVADPIYKLKSGRRDLRGWEELQAITDLLCDMAEVHSIPVVMSNQAQRHTGNRGDAPHKDQSFNGDAPVQEADHVIGLKHVKDEKKLVLRCTKNRFGEDFRVDLKFVPNVGIMEDVSNTNGNGYYSGNEDGSSSATEEAVKEIEEEAGYSKV